MKNMVRFEFMIGETVYLACCGHDSVAATVIGLKIDMDLTRHVQLHIIDPDCSTAEYEEWWPEDVCSREE